MSSNTELLCARVAGFRVDVAELRENYATIVKSADATPYRDNGTEYAGWSITSRDGSIDDGVQRISRTKENLASVQNSTVETPLCTGVIKTTLDQLRSLGLFHKRVRVMRLMNEGPKMTFHRDATNPAWRVHVPIFTTSDSVFQWRLDDDTVHSVHLLADGSAWFVRVDTLHRAINRSSRPTERVHLIMSLDNRPAQSLFESPETPTALKLPTAKNSESGIAPSYVVDHPDWENLKVTTRQELLMHLPSGGVVCEVGVFQGDFSEDIFRITQPRKLHLIDPWVHQDIRLWKKKTTDNHFSSMRKTQQRFQSEIGRRRVILHQGFSTDILSLFPESYFDWVYLDGDHRYESVRLELELCHTRVKPNGLILGHDYIKPELYPEDRRSNYQVVQAVNDFCATHEWHVVFQTPDQPPGSKQCPTFILQRRAPKPG